MRQVPEVFSEIHLASRTKSKCDAIAASMKQRTGRTVTTHAVDADNVAETVKLLGKIKPDLLVNLALPYQDLPLMDACLETGVNYMDTANYEPPEEAKFEYKWQWAYQERFEKAGLMALLGSGFDPGVTNVFAAHAMKHHFDEIHVLDIIDCNAGDHGQPFATNFNRRSTSGRSPSAAGTGSAASGLRPTRSPGPWTTSFPRASATRSATSCTTRSWNPWSCTSRASSAPGSG